MSRADEIRAKAQRVKSTATEAASGSRDQPKRAPQVRANKVRRTVDLSPTHHTALDTWCTETARELGKARVTGQDVLRTLVAQLLTDETLARKIRKALAEDQ